MELTRGQSEMNRQNLMQIWYMHCITFFARLVGIAEILIHMVVLAGLTLEMTDNMRGCGELCMYIGVNVKELDVYYEDGNVTWLCVDIDLRDLSANVLRRDRFSLFYTLCFLLIVAQLLSALGVVFGTLAFNKWYTVPYFMWRMFNFAIQVYCQINYYIVIEVLKVEVVLSSFAVFVTAVLFTLIVYMAVKRWPETSTDAYSEIEDGERESFQSTSEPQPGSSGESRPNLDTEAEGGSPPNEEEEEIDDGELRRRYSALLNPGPEQTAGAGAVTPEAAASGTDNDVVDETTPLVAPQRPRRPSFQIIAKALSFFVKPRISEGVRLEDRPES